MIVILPLLIPAFALSIMLAVQLVNVDVRPNEIILAIVGLPLLALLILGVWWVTFAVFWGLAQEIWPRRMVIDRRSQTATVQSIPLIKASFPLDAVEAIEIMWIRNNGRVWCYVCLRLKERRTFLRLFEVISKPGVAADDVDDAIGPFVDSISVLLHGAPVSFSRISVWRTFMILGI